MFKKMIVLSICIQVKSRTANWLPLLALGFTRIGNRQIVPGSRIWVSVKVELIEKVYFKKCNICYEANSRTRNWCRAVISWESGSVNFFPLLTSEFLSSGWNWWNQRFIKCTICFRFPVSDFHENREPAFSFDPDSKDRSWRCANHL